eukprot:CAMPEP_0184729320 /NCGR_PEP_ID=MMETSP0314-20130426/43767_1 /TAXON_ID=38298 /ORGANISM="Rhodella maculata, Strain CCMP 736" /LENGTH=348 /DNA_ID=CAMNT_0027195333 /DNA_START=346 /DNA_END=1388 /DNA_ORIENTATION=-
MNHPQYIYHTLHLVSINLNNDVANDHRTCARLFPRNPNDARALGSAPGPNAYDHDSVLRAHFPRDDLLRKHDAQHGPPNAPHLADLLKHAAQRVDRHAKPDANKASRAAVLRPRRARDGDGDADESPPRVEQRPAGVSRVHRAVDLEEVEDGAGGARVEDLAVDARDDAGGEGVLHAEGVADAEHAVADGDGAGRRGGRREGKGGGEGGGARGGGGGEVGAAELFEAAGDDAGDFEDGEVVGDVLRDLLEGVHRGALVLRGEAEGEDGAGRRKHVVVRGDDSGRGPAEEAGAGGRGGAGGGRGVGGLGGLRDRLGLRVEDEDVDDGLDGARVDGGGGRRVRDGLAGGR